MLIKLLGSGEIKIAGLVTHRYDFADIEQAYETYGAAAKHKAVKNAVKKTGSHSCKNSCNRKLAGAHWWANTLRVDSAGTAFVAKHGHDLQRLQLSHYPLTKFTILDKPGALSAIGFSENTQTSDIFNLDIPAQIILLMCYVYAAYALDQWVEASILIEDIKRRYNLERQSHKKICRKAAAIGTVKVKVTAEVSNVQELPGRQKWQAILSLKSKAGIAHARRAVQPFTISRNVPMLYGRNPDNSSKIAGFLQLQ
ncbi:hypothetical protein EDD18DRAFT_1107863 [Armillaria luteobubalina]|uniref:Uncharacterized protein n=1 Tax=Armillaria luteobubalina TaxID=153913 RepID=A0AA39Q175_9AGAR|nr:hypothetical protein EDD18DRAFT_1107863 [Armillaria luteobubalina]